MRGDSQADRKSQIGYHHGAEKEFAKRVCKCFQESENQCVSFRVGSEGRGFGSGLGIEKSDSRGV